MDFLSPRSTDLAVMWPNLAQRTRDEYQAASVPIGIARGYFRDWIKAGTAVSLVDGDSVLAIMGWMRTGEGLSTSFAGTEAFFEPQFVRPFRRYLHQLQAESGNPQIVSHSYSKHPKVERWFQALGFKLVSTEGVHRVFVLSPQPNK